MLAAALALSGIACHQGQKIREQALRDSSAVTFRAHDGTKLAGRVFGPEAASAGVVLSPMVASDQSAWFDLADRLGLEGYRVLTFNLRGICPGGDAGCSQGAATPAAATQDVQAAQAYLRSQGISRIALVGAGLGGTASLVTAAQPGSGVSVVITLSAVASDSGLAASPDVMQTVTAAKLFLAGSDDTLAADSAQSFYDSSLPPKELQLLTTADHGTDMLTGSQGEMTRNLIVGYLDRHMPATPAGPSP